MSQTALIPAPPLLHMHPLRVYWEDTDAGGVVFYANYLKFFERAGIGQHELRERTGAIFIVIDTRVRYLRPARLDDALQIAVTRAELGRATLTVHQHAWRGDELLCEGNIQIACVDHASFRPQRIPSDVLSRLTPP